MFLSYDILWVFESKCLAFYKTSALYILHFGVEIGVLVSKDGVYL